MKTATEEMKLLGDYKLIKMIGQGTLGAVFAAEHRYTKKQYAIKILPEELSHDRQFLSRFEDEVALLSALDHPNIAKIFNVSSSQGLYFFATECVVDKLGESTNLWQYFNSKERIISESELITIATHLAKALDYAHGAVRPVIHRNIKFNNILIGVDENNSPRISLSDFGLSKVVGIGPWLLRSYKTISEALGMGNLFAAKAIDTRYPSPVPESARIALLTQSFSQNIYFLAPEQKRGDAGVDSKADMYAYGVLIYFLLMNEFPEGIFSLPSTKNKEMNWNWDLVVSECLKQDPKERPESLEALLDKAKGNLELFSLPEAAVQPIVKPKIEKKEMPAPSLPKSAQVDLFALTDPVYAACHVDLPKEERVVKEYQPEKKELKQIKPLLTEMVVIPSDQYQRGSNSGCRDELPRHKVKLAPFALDIHPVTNEQYVRYLEFVGEEKDSHNQDLIRLRESRIKKSSGKFTIEAGYAKHPVVGVTWYGAVGYASWVGKRLPTEAEWEIACAGNLENPTYPTGENIEKTQANFFSSDTTAVMSYPENGYGLYDMAGNVYEWCQDWYDYSYYEASAQEPDYPKGPLQGVYRVLRGGCWKSLKEDLRTSKRHRNNPGASNSTYGFRCAADAT